MTQPIHLLRLSLVRRKNSRIKLRTVHPQYKPKEVTNMARKPYQYKELSNIRCHLCGKRLKKNVIVRKPTADTCYVCSRILRITRQEGRNAR